MNQPKSIVEGKVIYLLIMVVVVQFGYPFTANNSPAFVILYQLLYISLFVLGIMLARDHKILTYALAASAAIWLIVGVIYAFNQESFWPNLVGYIAIFVFQAVVTYILLRYIFSTKHVSRDVLYAAVAVYLLLGALFVPIYGTIETLTWFPEQTTHAFLDSAQDPADPILWQTFVYYSYTNLTTLGYGDVLPQTLWARSVATFEAVVGVLYVTIIMARLVGLYANEDNSTNG